MTSWQGKFKNDVVTITTGASQVILGIAKGEGSPPDFSRDLLNNMQRHLKTEGVTFNAENLTMIDNGVIVNTQAAPEKLDAAVAAYVGYLNQKHRLNPKYTEFTEVVPFASRELQTAEEQWSKAAKILAPHLTDPGQANHVLKELSRECGISFGSGPQL